MPSVTYTTTASPAKVWSILSNGWLYSSWVVGASRIRSVDETWPQAGSRIHHSVGTWPLLLDDITVSRESSAGSLILTAHASPVGKARIELTIEKHEHGAQVTMAEHAESLWMRWIPDSAQHVAMAPRLRECLRRLTLLAENGAH
ncbi:SRPBCC family protein [Gordonia soli]|uniref:Polyketide cyclase/dehydrase n=1 Tax=Gordonia soli NBRC 108243 TaxID=1223545 RepID=M0QN17_9ACTN|nr:SRPBCC family protein [Gordonia soli]GAC69958.1 hypothetical protein GS4_30_00300 [Gordonia soli NBRC 108243]